MVYKHQLSSNSLKEIMDGRWIYVCAILIGMSNTQYSDENNDESDDFAVTDSEGLKKTEATKDLNGTSTEPPGATYNVFIKPKLIIGAPLNSFKQGSGNSAHKTLALPHAESNMVLVQPDIPQLPEAVVPPTPPMIIPMNIERDIQIPQLPFAVPNICQLVPCPPDVVPVSPYFPQLLNTPVVIENPVRPILIREAPQLVPVAQMAPQPLQVAVHSQSAPSPDNRIMVTNFCPTVITCNLAEKDTSLVDFLNDLLQKVKSFVNPSGVTTTTESSVPDNSTEKPPCGIPLSYPTSCAKGIISERFVPNMVPNDDIKVVINTSAPPQMSHYYYRK